MSEYQRLKELIARYEREEEQSTDMYTEAGVELHLDEETLQAEEEAFLLGYLAS